MSLLQRPWLLTIASLVLTAPAVLADGGVLQIHQQIGSLAISVFSLPTPLRAGAADLSVLVQDAHDQTIFVDAHIVLYLSLAGQSDLLVQATREQATNKLLYAARVAFPIAGKWRLRLRCRQGAQDVEMNGVLTVLPKEPPLLSYWMYFAVVPVSIALFALNQWLAANRRIRNPRGRP